MDHPAIEQRRVGGNLPANVVSLRRQFTDLRDEVEELRAAMIEQREVINALTEAQEKPASRRGRPRKADVENTD